MSKISVVIPVYNSSQTIGQCLKSVFAQTFKDLEVIAIDDGSTDSSWSALEKWQAEEYGGTSSQKFWFYQKSW